MENLNVPVNLIQATLNFLGTCPYNQVSNLINGYNQVVQMANMPTQPIKEEVKKEEVKK